MHLLGAISLYTAFVSVVSASPRMRSSARAQNATYLNSDSKEFAVDGSGIPDVPFDVGESYAGLLPISSGKNETRKLFFWFFPSEDPQAGDEITIWLNGGPGCSSLSGLLTENGPFLWQAGTLAPVRNPYSWSRLTNMVWVEQPVGTGFSQGEPNIKDERELAEQFKGFWKNFMDTFKLKGRKVYLTGESYAGMYVPYIANGFLEANDTQYFNVRGIAINNPLIGNRTMQGGIEGGPVEMMYVDYWSRLLGFNDTLLHQLHEQNDRSGCTKYTSTHLQFPPPELPWDPSPDCGIADTVASAVSDVNPCFNIYHITDTCPFPYSQLGIVNPDDYEPPGGVVYFNRTDVQKAINAPVGANWHQCAPAGRDVFDNGTDTSPPPTLNGVLANVIEKTQNAIVGSGGLDSLLPSNGTLLALQGMAWGGKQGFQSRPSTSFFVPKHKEVTLGRQGGQGSLGVWAEERGLTWYDIPLSGHELPGYQASAGYRVLQRLLGRIKDFNSTEPLF